MPSPPPLPVGPIPTNAVISKSFKQVNSNRNKTLQSNNQIKNKSKQINKAENDKNTNRNKASSKESINDDDGWEHYFDDSSQRYFFYNSVTKVKQWKNPRVSDDDEFNKNLPTYPPPILPFEEKLVESEYTKALKSLKHDEEFEKLSTFEKYKKAEELKKRFEDNTDSTYESTKHNETANTKQVSEINIHTKKSIIRSNHGESNIQSKNNKITKKQVKYFNDRKKQQREKKLKTWLTKD